MKRICLQTQENWGRAHCREPSGDSPPKPCVVTDRIEKLHKTEVSEDV